jgi:hypothetical protein
VDHAITLHLPVTLIPTGNHTIGSGGAILGPSGIQFDNIPGGSTLSLILGPSGIQFDNIPASSTAAMANTKVGGQSLSNGGLHATQTTAVNYNSPLITLDTSGRLTITNFSAAVTAFSFSELIPLITA